MSQQKEKTKETAEEKKPMKNQHMGKYYHVAFCHCDDSESLYMKRKKRREARKKTQKRDEVSSCSSLRHDCCSYCEEKKKKKRCLHSKRLP